MADNRTPYQFRPMNELTAEGRKVEMALSETGRVVTGWLFCGHPMAARTFWALGQHGHESIEPVGWREIPTPEIIADWKKRAA